MNDCLMNTRIGQMLSRARAKVANERGDTIVETLVALTIAGLSLLILAMAISTAATLATRSADKLDDEYALESALADAVPNTDCRGTASLTLSNGTAVPLGDAGTEIDVTYCLPQGQSKQIPVISYIAEDGD